MPITPAGAPIWARTATIEHFGGHLDKRDFNDRAGIDPLTDVSAAQFARLTADLTAIARTAPFAELVIRLRPNGAPIVECVQMATGVRLVSYTGDEPPPGYPSARRNGASDITVTFASSYADAYGVVAPFSVRSCSVCPTYGSVARAVMQIATPQSVRIRIFNDADAPITEQLPPRERDPVDDRPEVSADGVLRVTLAVY